MRVFGKLKKMAGRAAVFVMAAALAVTGLPGTAAEATSGGTDPWMTFAGSAQATNEEPNCMTVDSSGNVFVVGMGHDPWGVTPVHAAEGDENTNFLAKFNSAGSLVWHTFFMVPECEEGFISRDVAVDNNGNIYVVGHFQASSNWDRAFVYKFNSSGEYVHHLLWGNSGETKAAAVTVYDGYVYVTGGTNTDFINTPDLREHDLSGMLDIFLVKLDTNLITQWYTFLGGIWDNRADDIEFDSNGMVYLSGYSDGPWLDAGTPVQPYVVDDEESRSFSAKYDIANKFVEWHTFFGHGGIYIQSKIRLALSGGNIYLTGDSNATWGEPIREYVSVQNARDAFVAKLNNNGVLQWNTFLGASYLDYGCDIAANGDNVYVTGTSEQSWGDSPLRPKYPGENLDTFVANLDTDGILQWNTFLGGSNGDKVSAITFFDNFLYIAGHTYVATWGNPLNPYSGGSEDIYLVKLTADGQLEPPAHLTSLAENLAADFDPGFAGGTTAYALTAANAEATVNLTATLEGGTITYTYTGVTDESVDSGTDEMIPLSVGANVITIKAAKAGCAETAYTVTITRAAPPPPANLTGLTENLSAAFSPAFESGTYAYTLAAAHTEDSVNLTAILDGATVVYTYGGSGHASGEYIPLAVGQNVITVTVSKTGCTDAVYTVTVTRAEPPSSVATVTSGVYTVDNDADTITGVPYNTAKAAFLANLSKGQADQTWNGTGIADPVVTGNKLVVTAQDGTANVTYTITVNAAPGGGGGNGGGYVPPVVQEPEPEPEPEEELPAGATDVSGSIDTEGHFTEAVTIAAENTTVVLEIGQGTIGLDADEHPLGEITVVPLAEPPADPPAGTVALVYDFGPDGATFEPAIRMSIPLPEGIDPANTSIAYWNGNEWEVLETEYDPATGRLTAFTNHFSIFAVLVLEPEVTAEEPVIEPADEPEPVVSEPAPGPIIDDMPESEAPASQESSLDVAGKAGNGFAWYWWLIIAVACVVIGTTVYLDRKQRKARE